MSRAIAAVVLSAGLVLGQVHELTPATSVDLSQALKTAPVRVSATDPLTCDAAIREMYYNTVSGALRVCNAADTWSDLAGA